MRKQIIAPAAALLLIMVVISCRQDLPVVPSPVGPALKYTVPGDQYTFYADSEKYTMTSLDRTKDYLCNFPWNVVSVVRTDNMVSVHISRPIECQVEYELIWDGTLMHSYPMMANVFINAISQNCTNKGQVGVDTLNIDLKKTFKDLSEATLENTNFLIREVCALKDIQCMDDCNVSVSN